MQSLLGLEAPCFFTSNFGVAATNVETPSPSSHLQAPPQRRRGLLTRTASHDTIPVRLYRPGHAPAQCNRVLSLMGTTRDKTLFVRRISSLLIFAGFL